MAHPERVNLERVLGQASAAASADARLQSRTWRVVREDGSKTALPSDAGSDRGPAEPVPSVPSQPAASAPVASGSQGSNSASLANTLPQTASPPNLGFLGGKGLRNAIGLDLSAAEGPAARSNIGMPKASPTLAETPPPSATALGKAPKAHGKTSGKSTGRPALETSASRLLGSAPAAPSRPAVRQRAASGAHSHDTERDLQLLRVIDAWPALSARAREAILAVIDASRGR